jgi:hypothetical protein
MLIITMPLLLLFNKYHRITLYPKWVFCLPIHYMPVRHARKLQNVAFMVRNVAFWGEMGRLGG